MSNCLVLGANGFIGSHLVDVLANQGHFVRCFDKYKTKDIIFSNQDHHDIEIYRGDFMSRSSMEQALDGIDYVFHFISMTNPFTAENDPLIDIETNVRMSIELFDLCAQKNIKKIIFASTGGAIYGDIDGKTPISEDTYPKPISPYAIGKLTIENYLRYFKKKHGLDYQVLRISNPYGPRQNTLSGQGVIPIFLERVSEGKPITIYGDGSMIRDYLYVEDLASMIASSFQSQGKYNVYNIGSGKGYSVNELVDVVRKVTGKDVLVELQPTPSTFVQNVVLDTKRFVQDFSIKPETQLEEGVRKTWQDLQKRIV